MASFEFEKELIHDSVITGCSSPKQQDKIKTDKNIHVSFSSTDSTQSLETLSKPSYQSYQTLKKSRFCEQQVILQPASQKITLKDLENMGVKCNTQGNLALKQKLLKRKYQQKNLPIEFSMEFVDFDENNQINSNGEINANDEINEINAVSCSQFHTFNKS